MTAASASTPRNRLTTNPLGPLPPLARLGGASLALVEYLGGLAILAGAAACAPWTRRRGQPRLLPALIRQLDDLLRIGLPWLAILHIAFAAFLAMQAFFRATFAESNGAVVGLGLMRSISPLLAGFALGGVLAVQTVLTLADGLRPGLDDDPDALVDRDVMLGRAPDPRPLPDPGRLAFVRIGAAALAGPLLVVWGSALGMLVGLGLSSTLLGVSSGIYFGLFFDMLRVSDVVGIFVTGAAYPALAALIACHEALRLASTTTPGQPRPARDSLRPIARIVLLSALAMLVVDAAWFTLTYISGPPFGVGFDPPSGHSGVNLGGSR
ncbi:MAG: hypothetical protein KatS3mg108_2403 [Isosphaeraceae bacterium]|nr:MAG: hypothetical protein KatS3mg108_2403 [Isosphaeraceae bacterium]